MQPWLLYAAISGIASNTQNYFARLSLRNKGDALAYAWYFEVIRTICALFFLKNNYYLEISTASFIALATLGFVEFCSIVFFVKMHSYAELSLSSIISRTRVIWVAVISYFMFSEVLTFGGYMGIAFVFLGISITQAPKKLFVDKGVRYSIIFSFFASLVGIAMKAASPYASETIIVMAMAIPPIVLIPFVRKNALGRIKKDAGINVLSKLAGGFLSFAALFIFAYTIKLGPISKITAVYQATMIVSVLMGILLLGERDHAVKKLLGAALTIVGVIILQIF